MSEEEEIERLLSRIRDSCDGFLKHRKLILAAQEETTTSTSTEAQSSPQVSQTFKELLQGLPDLETLKNDFIIQSIDATTPEVKKDLKKQNSDTKALRLIQLSEKEQQLIDLQKELALAKERELSLPSCIQSLRPNTNLQVGGQLSEDIAEASATPERLCRPAPEPVFLPKAAVMGKAPGPPPTGPQGSPRGVAPGPPPPLGKAKAKAPPPPPPPAPKAKSKSKARASIVPDADRIETEKEDPLSVEQDAVRARRASISARLVSVHWRPSQGPPQEIELNVHNDSYLSSVLEMSQRWSNVRAERFQSHVSTFERNVIGTVAAKEELGDDISPMSDLTSSTAEESPSTTRVRRRRQTVFTASENIPILELHHAALEEFFQARASAVDMGTSSSSRSSVVGGGVTNLITDPKHRQILDIIIRKEAVQKHQKLPQQAAVEAAASELRLAILRCDFESISSCVLEDLKKVVCGHQEIGTPILAYVEAKGGPEALETLEQPYLHKFMYGLLRIPGVSQRLECTAIAANFSEHLSMCHENLKVLQRALHSLSACIGVLRKLWILMLRLGNTLNDGSTAPISEHGFRLASLSKLLELRSPLRKELSLLHLALMWLPADEVDTLCDRIHYKSLQNAQTKRTQTVYLDLVIQLDSFRQMQALIKTGRYKATEIKPCLDTEDRGEDHFFENMQRFVETRQKSVEEVRVLGKEVFGSYKSLGSYFADLPHVYPPPKDDQDTKRDLFDIFSKFLMTVQRAHTEIDNFGLALEVQRLDQTRPPWLANSIDVDTSAKSKGKNERLPEVQETGEHSTLTENAKHVQPAKEEPSVVSPCPVLSASPAPSLPKSPLRRRSLDGASDIRRHLEVSFEDVTEDRSTHKENLEPDAAEAVQKYQSPCGKQRVTVSPLPLAESKVQNLFTLPAPVPSSACSPCTKHELQLPPPARQVQVRQKRPSQEKTRQVCGVSGVTRESKRGVFGTEPLNISLAPPMPTGVISPHRARTPGSANCSFDRTPPPDLSQLARKSLTHQVEQKMVECFGSNIVARREVTHEDLSSFMKDDSSKSCSRSPRSLVPEHAWEYVEGIDASRCTQIRTEFKRRKSRGRATPTSVPTTPVASLISPVSPRDLRSFHSPRAVAARYYGLTPVNEKGETPYRRMFGMN